MRRWLIWLFPLIFVIHDGEEVVTAAGWVHEHQELLGRIAALNPAASRAIAGLPHSTIAMAGAVAVILLIVLAATVGLWLRWDSRIALHIYAGLLAAYVVHVATHVVYSIALGSYTPGVISSVLVVPPVGVYLYKKLLQGTALTGRAAWMGAVAGLAALGAILPAAHRFGGWIAGSR